MDEMINALTKGIGVELGKPIRRAYYEKKRVLLSNEDYNKCSDHIKKFLVDVTALSIFNEHVIVPLHGSLNFARGTRPYGVKAVRMNEYRLDSDFYRTADRVTKQFFAITGKYGLPIEKLGISSSREFVVTWIELARNRGN